MIEVMVALLLTAIAVIGIVGLYSVQTRASSWSRHSTEAAVLAADKMEFLRTQGTLPATGQDVVDALGNPVAGAPYTRDWTITPGATITNYEVTVGWDEDGRPYSTTMRSRRTQ